MYNALHARHLGFINMLAAWLPHGRIHDEGIQVMHHAQIINNRHALKLHAAGTIITLKNQCTSQITAFARHGTSETNKYTLPAKGGSKDLNVGPKWETGLIWASPTGNTNNGQVSGAAFPHAVLTAGVVLRSACNHLSMAHTGSQAWHHRMTC